MKRNFMLLLFILFTCSSIFSQKKPFTIETLYKVKDISSPDLSPTGDWICFQSTEYNLQKGESNSDLYIINKDGSGLENITESKESESSPFWNINGRKIYFLKKSQIYSISIPDKKLSRLQIILQTL